MAPQETNLYYLQSRYYDPEVGRFINADVFVATGQGMLGNNMFAYCRNNPVCRKDVSGTTSVEIFDSDGDLLEGEKEYGGSGNGYSSPGGNNSGNSLKRVGGGHGNPEHSDRINQHMNALEQSGEYVEIYGNRALKTAGLEGNQRPDVVAVGHDGRVEVWEFASPSQKFGTRGYLALQAKIGIMQAANPTAKFYPIVLW